MEAVIPATPAGRSGSALGGLHRLFDAWGHGLRLALPVTLRQRWFPLPPGVWLKLEGDTPQAWVGRRDEAAPVTASGVDAEAVLARHPDLPRWLLLSPANAVRSMLSLPQAADGHLHEALRYEIDRQTPFTAADVAWDARALSIDPVAQQLRAELVAVPLARLAPLLARAQALGLVLQGVDVARDDGLPSGVNLLPAELRLQPVNRWRRRNLVLAAIAFGLVVMAGFGSIQREKTRAADIETKLRQERDEARRVSEQRQRLADLTEGARQIQAQRERRAPLSALLNALGERLPANSYVERLSVQGAQMQISGVSPQSTRLVPALQGSPLWRDVAMSGAVAADAGNGGDRYTVSMRLLPPSTGTAR